MHVVIQTREPRSRAPLAWYNPEGELGVPRRHLLDQALRVYRGLDKLRLHHRESVLLSEESFACTPFNARKGMIPENCAARKINDDECKRKRFKRIFDSRPLHGKACIHPLSRVSMIFSLPFQHAFVEQSSKAEGEYQRKTGGLVATPLTWRGNTQHESVGGLTISTGTPITKATKGREVSLLFLMKWVGRRRAKAERYVHLEIVDHCFSLLQLLQAVTVTTLVGTNRLSLCSQHFEVKFNELQIGRRRGVRLAPQFPLEP